MRYGMADEVVQIPAFMQQMAEAIDTTASRLNRDQMAKFFHEILSAKRVYVTGAGRSGFIAKAFGMRLMHLGYEAYVVGETITPAFRPGDVLVAFSGSGETHSILSICETAKDLGGTVCLITASPDSRMSRTADCLVSLGDLTSHYRRDNNTFEIRQLSGKYRSITSAFAPLGTLFETLALIFSDAVISSLMEERREDIPSIRDRLTNME
jgi:6-phospho-3-hexuloisomerase